MYENKNRSSFGEILKWFLIWNILALICRGIAFIFKMLFIAIEKLILFIAWGIGKTSPILKTKFEEFRITFNSKYKPKIKEKWKGVILSFKLLKDNMKNSMSKAKEKRRIRKENRRNKRMLKKAKKQRTKGIRVKKVKYAIADFFYDYSVRILFTIVIVAIVVAFLLFSIQAGLQMRTMQ